MRNTDLTNLPSEDSLRIIDLILPVYPYDLELNGPASIEHNDSGVYRWFCGKKNVVSFSLAEAAPLELMLEFTSVLPGQGMTLHCNGNLLASFEELTAGQQYSASYTFAGEKQNSITIRYKTTNGESATFPEDSRDLAMIFSQFSIYRSAPEMPSRPQDRFTLSSVPYLGDPEANARLLQEEYEAGKTILTALPSVVTVALTTHCNNRIPCVICDRNTRPSHADAEINADILEKVSPLLSTARYVLLHCGGEAMLSRHFDEVISAISPPTRVSFATNAMLMTRQRADNMLEKDIMAGFVVSLDAASDKTYRIMRPGSDFDTVIGNVAYYIDKAKKLGRDESTVKLNMTLCEANIHEAPLLVDLAERIGATSVEFNHLNVGPSHVVDTSEGWQWDYVAQSQFKDKERHDGLLLEAYYKAKELGIDFVLVGTPFLGKNADKYQEIVCDMTCQVAFQEGEGQTHWNSPHHKKLSPKFPACFKPWQEAVIQPNGIMRACYFHEMSLWTVGNLHFSNFMEVWNSDQMIKVREQFLSHAFARCCAESQPCMHRGRI